MIPSYHELVTNVRDHGDLVTPRGIPTREVIGGRVRFRAGEMVSRKGINDKLGWMELLQLLGGTFSPEGLKVVAPKAKHEFFTEQMAYGPRCGPYLAGIITALRVDPDTRQAVLFIGRPEDGPTSDLTCTLTIQFLVRKGAVNAVVSMRSWDLIRGLPYDIVMFGGLTMAVARCLHLQAGQVIVTAGSTHVYLSDDALLPSEPTNLRWFGFAPTEKFRSPNGGDDPDFRSWALDQVGYAPWALNGGVPEGIVVSSTPVREPYPTRDDAYAEELRIEGAAWLTR